MLTSVAGVLVGAAFGWALSSLQKSSARPQQARRTRHSRFETENRMWDCSDLHDLYYSVALFYLESRVEEYAEFEGSAALQRNLWSAAAKARSGPEVGCRVPRVERAQHMGD